MYHLPEKWGWSASIQLLLLGPNIGRQYYLQNRKQNHVHHSVRFWFGYLNLFVLFVLSREIKKRRLLGKGPAAIIFDESFQYIDRSSMIPQAAL